MMKQTIFSLAMAILLPAALLAQAPIQAPVRVVDTKSMYEDVEVLRRLLSREFPNHSAAFQPLMSQLITPYVFSLNNAATNSYFGLTTAVPATGNSFVHPYLGSPLNYNINTTNASANQTPAVSFEGVYLKGHGVAYMASIPAKDTLLLKTPQKTVALVGACGICHGDAAIRKSVQETSAPTAKPLSDWEKVQHEIRGAAEEPKPQTSVRFLAQDVCTPGNFTEHFLKILAENGHNFKQLSDNENITICITLSGDIERAKSTTRKTARNLATALNAARELSSVADLHFKQENNETAEKGFADAIKLLVAQPLAPNADAAVQANAIEEAKRFLSGLYAKQAQVFLRLNKLQEAKEATTKSLSPDLNVSAPKPSKESAPAPIPLKLLVSVSKKALNDVHSGKIDMVQFRKLADVQTIDVNSPKK